MLRRYDRTAVAAVRSITRGLQTKSRTPLIHNANRALSVLSSRRINNLPLHIRYDNTIQLPVRVDHVLIRYKSSSSGKRSSTSKQESAEKAADRSEAPSVEKDSADSKQQREAGESTTESKANSDGKKEDEPQGWFASFQTVSVVGMIVFVGAVGYLVLSSSSRNKELNFQEFRNRLLERGVVEKLIINPTSKRVDVIVKPEERPPTDNPLQESPSYHFQIGSVESFENELREAMKELGFTPRQYVPIQYVDSVSLSTFVSIAVQIGMLAFVIYVTRSAMGGMNGGSGRGGRGGGMRNIFSIGRSTATVIKPGEMTKVTFADVAGLDDAKVEVMEFVKFLKSPDQFTKLGAKIPKGALLCGPPGTGKTLLAKAMAGEASVPFFSISGSDFLEMFVGVGPSRVRDLFKDARAAAPCIVFIDEIDAVGRSRAKGNFSGSHDERENTLNQLLVEMDGFSTTEGVVVLAGTNRKDILDKALLRPGRFDRHINIDKPDMRGRAQIFMVHLKPLKIIHSREDLANRLSALTPGFAGADIAALCNEAALIAARTNKEHVELVDFEKAADRVIGGLEKTHSVMTAAEKRLVAHHEAGHAVVGWFLQYADPLLKVTIVPRGNGALGFAQYLPKELALYTQQQLNDMMAMSLGGRAAELVFFTEVSTGAGDDLQKVTRIAQSQVSVYGMSQRLGNVAYNNRESEDEMNFTKPFSENTAQQIDEEVRTLVGTAFDRAIALVKEHRDQVEALANKLIEKETVNHDDLVAILGPRPFPTDTYTDWMKNRSIDVSKPIEPPPKKETPKPKSPRKPALDGDVEPILNPF